MTEVSILGAGLAGSAAAITACQAGASVRLFEKSVFPRHKVCGEFLSPEVEALIDSFGIGDAFHSLRPYKIARLGLHFPRCSKYGRLPEPGLGLTRYRLDQLLLERAVSLGARVERESAVADWIAPPMVIATGRHFPAKRGGRLFGFKAHHRGPQTDSVELFFFKGCYVGVNAVEDGVTNVCGLGPEELLKQYAFEPDALLASFAPLRERLKPLTRSMDWLTTGPLVFEGRFEKRPEPGHYFAGDQLNFVDPFTGTGMLAALLSGSLAGRSAATALPVESYLREISHRLSRASRVSSVFRWSIESGWAERLVTWIPSRLLFGLTRPRV